MGGAGSSSSLRKCVSCSCGDAGERLAVDEFHRHHDRRRVVAGAEQSAERPDRDRRNDGGAACKRPDHHGLRMLAVVGLAWLGETERAVQGRIAPARIGEHQSRSASALSAQDAFDASRPNSDGFVVAVEDEDVVVIEVGFQPKPDALLRPGRVVFDTEFWTAWSAAATLLTSPSTRSP